MGRGDGVPCERETTDEMNARILSYYYPLRNGREEKAEKKQAENEYLCFECVTEPRGNWNWPRYMPAIGIFVITFWLLICLANDRGGSFIF